jgi:hypothetical protein
VKVLDQSASDAVVDPGPGGWPVDLRVLAAPPLGIVEGAAVAEVAP